MRSRTAILVILTFLGCGGRLTSELGGSSSSNVDAERAAAESGSGRQKGKARSEPSRSPPSSDSDPPALPAPLAEPGLVIDAVLCDVSREKVLPVAAPGHLWQAEAMAECGGGIGIVYVFAGAHRDMPFPIECGEKASFTILRASEADGGVSYATGNPGGACSIASGPPAGVPAVTAVVKSYAGAAHYVAYRAATQ